MPKEFRPKIHVLPDPQRRIWDELEEVPPCFALYGGTALALHLGHRESIDFDFFGDAEFDADQLLRDLSILRNGTVIQKSPDTLTVVVDRDGPVQLSFFAVPGLLRIDAPCLCRTNGLRIASLRDLAGTKAAVVQKRAEAKDYVDVDAIIQDGSVDLPAALSAAGMIYGKSFRPELTLKALCFFGDGNLADVPADVRSRLAIAVKAVDLNRLPELTGNSQPQEEGDR